MRDERCLCGRESCLTCKLWLEVNLDTMDSLERHILPHWSNTTSNKSSDTTTPHCRDGSSVPRARAPRALVDLLGDVVRGRRHDRQHLVDVMLEPADERQRVIARLEHEELLLRAPGRHEKGIAKQLGGVQQRTIDAPGSHQRASISSELHDCVTWTSTLCVALELSDSAEQKGRLVERDDARLHVERVEHP